MTYQTRPQKPALCLRFQASVREVSASLRVSRGVVLHPRVRRRRCRGSPSRG